MTNQPFPTWPPAETKLETLYLTADQELTTQPDPDESSLSYQADSPAQQMDQDTDELCFTHTFAHTCTILGSARAVLHMSTTSHDDMDVHVQIRKADANGTVLQQLNIPQSDLEAVGMTGRVEPVNPMIYLGPTGALRASYRAIDDELSTEYWPEHKYTRCNKLGKGEIVRLDIRLWQTGIRFEAGEKLVLKVSGHPMVLAEFPPLRGALPNANVGKHVAHIGGSRASCLVIPVVPSS